MTFAEFVVEVHEALNNAGLSHAFGGDLRAIASARSDLDVEYVERQLIGLRGPAMHPRVTRLRRLLREAHG